MAKSDKRVKIQMKCADCDEKNYSTFKNKVNTTGKLNLSKYCPTCRKHTVHKEVK
ncbi:MAG: 50S ribosomal protein L33 [Candidatus Aminicenantes bacterium]|nr:50S ribosomal protein L33 [Candidatus Aminicenantes bacterium]